MLKIGHIWFGAVTMTDAAYNVRRARISNRYTRAEDWERLARFINWFPQR